MARGPTRLALAELSRLLLQPAAGLLGRKRLLVVARRRAPLHPLRGPARARDGGGSGAGPPGGTARDRHAPSASASSPRGRCASRPAVPPGSSRERPRRPAALAVVADPVFTSFSPLPFSREEARAILALAPASGRLSALGLDASRETVLSGELGATASSTSPPTESSTRTIRSCRASCSPRWTPGAGRGGLRARPRDLSPEPAGGPRRCSRPAAPRSARRSTAKGLVGLTRGFQYAGARGVLVSLWEVEDRATAELMSRLYREMLQRGRTPAAALRTAQTALREAGWRDPYYWAGFILQGDWRPADKPFHIPPGSTRRNPANHSPKGGRDETADTLVSTARGRNRR